jgi:hypothetical protein
MRLMTSICSQRSKGWIAKTSLRAAADREFHQPVVPQPVGVDGILCPQAIAETRWLPCC